MENTDNMWWGYLHTNGNIQVKRYFDRKDISEAMQSDFVEKVAGPFHAENRETAIKEVEKIIWKEI